MLTQENEYYIRLILLLLRGGTLVLKQVFLKKLEDQGSQLNAFLQINKEAIKTLKEGKVLTLKQYNILYPVNGSVTEICEWDISLLACVLLNFFVQSFQKSEEKAIENIRTFRNDFAGHHPDGCIDARTFFRKWNQLSNFITNLGNGLSSSERSDLAELIKCVGDDPIEIRRAIQDIKDATGTKDQFMEHVSQLLEHLSHTVEQLNSRQDEMSKVLQDSQTDIKELKNSNRNVSTRMLQLYYKPNCQNFRHFVMVSYSGNVTQERQMDPVVARFSPDYIIAMSPLDKNDEDTPVNFLWSVSPTLAA
ncbi:uncharacterized protein LOC128552180 [Mercenaria mercenaria]|uniref:uncharacterized protein LOC128552180 n=1 Tax=Mercenaria mercenaria TaxID=6596 RepID=UPI00234E50BB|nr:uncharacterized protein LOC128552180 [Mercenaria mercenaria]